MSNNDTDYISSGYNLEGRRSEDYSVTITAEKPASMPAAFAVANLHTVEQSKAIVSEYVGSMHVIFPISFPVDTILIGYFFD